MAILPQKTTLLVSASTARPALFMERAPYPVPEPPYLEAGGVDMSILHPQPLEREESFNPASSSHA